MRARFAVSTLTCVVAAGLSVPALAFAHGVLVGRQDLPIPRWLFAWAAAVVLIASFALLAFAWRTARYEGDSWRPAPALLSRALLNPLVETLAGLAGVFLLILVIYSGLSGTESPDRNFSVSFVFVTFWIGFAGASALLGNVFRAFNPWRAFARAIAGVFELVARQRPQAPFRYPERLGRWPAAIAIALFMWFELVWSVGLQSIGVTPRDVGAAAAVYSIYTFAGMALFGIETWCRRGEAFSVLYEMFSGISRLEARDRTLGLRRWVSGTTGWAAVSGSLAVILILIGGTAYDGASEGVLSGVGDWLFERLADVGFSEVLAFRLANTIEMLGVIAAVALIFWAGIAGMHTVRSKYSTAELGGRFAHAFIPIALAYLIAHYFSLFWFVEQAQFTYLLSDPLGTGADIFGTASGSIDYGSLSATVVWYVQVGALVLGHALALVLGHDRALAVYGDAKLATRSQYWMLGMMVAFTVIGLFLLSQSNG